MASPRKTRSVFSTVLDQPPSCIEFSPVVTKLFIVGTYHLEKDSERDGRTEDDETHVPQSRSGYLALFTIADDEIQAWVPNVT
jgi:diphthamide biosynthesis protein 7